MNATHAAHIVTSEAQGLGDPEIIIMTRDEGMGADEVDRFPLHPIPGTDTPETDPGRIWNFIYAMGWRPLGEPTRVDTGYWILDVEKVGA